MVKNTMNTWIRNVNNVACDATTVDPATLYHPTLAVQFISVPEDVQNGALWTGKAWVNPAPLDVESALDPVTPASIAPTLPAWAFYERFSVQEAAAINASDDLLVKELRNRLERREKNNVPVDCADPDVIGMLVLLVQKELLTKERMRLILSVKQA
ncbi:MAG: hypothetical protein RL748_2172 [Pseudomonadota bacterium]|jgi:hypothetical protein